MTVELLLVLLFQAEQDLHGASVLRDLAGLGDHDLRSILEDVRRDVLAGNGVLRDTLLVHAHLRTMSGR